MTPQTTLQDIHDPETRDLVRGLLDRNIKRQDLNATLSRLLATVQKSDLRPVDAVLRHNQLFQHLELHPEFPAVAPFQGERGIILIPPGGLALDYITLRISENEATVCAALEKLEALNRAIHSNQNESIASSLTEIIECSGHSLTLARKAAFVVGYAIKDSVPHKACVELVSSYGVNQKNYGTMATIDAIGADFNYLDLKYRFRDFATLEGNATIASKISHLCFAPLATTKDELIEIVRASYEVSLVDAAIALLVHVDEKMVEASVPASVAEAWASLSLQPEGVFRYLDRLDSFIDLWAFRSATAFLEYKQFRRLRYALQPLYDLPIGGSASERNSASARQYSAAFFDGVERIADVVPPTEHDVAAAPERFNRETAGVLARSCALVWVLEKDADFSSITTEEMALLMGKTTEIDRLVSTETLRRAVGTASNSFVRLILQTLLRAHSAATRDNFNFKDQFQRYVRDHHNGDTLDFLKMARSLDKQIIGYFVNLLDETMLSQMAFLMESSEAIYETRARILDWYSEITHDISARDKAKQLRVDRKIAAVRGAINETRLNIDSVRFRQWIEQNKLSDFSDFIRQSQPNLPPIADLIDSSKKSTLFLAVHREPTLLALSALVSCYDEFCRNPDYGIASFLGRRIRHGTLRGTLMNGLADGGELEPSSRAQYLIWKREFSKSIDALAGRLYFRDRTEHKDGLLSPDIENEQKWQISLICLTRIFTQAQQDQGVMFAPYLIEQFCWLVFETELAKVQTSIGEARTKWGSLKLHHPTWDATAAQFERTTNLTVGDHFATVTSWFRKPPNISPVAELGHIIQVVIGEAREEYASFQPEIVLPDCQGLELSGATYYVVYDALTIAVRNAAKHGSHPGSVRIDAEVKDLDSAKILQIAVTSGLREGDSIQHVFSRIEGAGLAGAVDADVVEGWSGMRKLKKMERERSILRFTPSSAGDCDGSLCLTIEIPFKGLVE